MEKYKYVGIKRKHMAEDISRNVLFLLVVLTVVFSLLGAWTVLSHVNAGQAPSVPQQRVSSGQVSLTIGSPQTSEMSDFATGKVVFNIAQPK